MSRAVYNYKISFTALAIFLITSNFLIQLEPVEHFDQQILEWFAASRTVAVDRFYACISWAGSMFILLPLTFAITALLVVRKHPSEALFFAASFVGASVLSYILKFVIARPRPKLFPVVIDIPAGFSFPSSHAAQITAFVLALLLLLNVSTGTRWFFLLNSLGGLLIVLVCVSRIYLQVHYPTDVVAGFLTSLFWVVSMTTIMLAEKGKKP